MNSSAKSLTASSVFWIFLTVGIALGAFLLLPSVSEGFGFKAPDFGIFLWLIPVGILLLFVVRVAGISFNLLLVIAAIVAHLFLGNFDIGPFSVRIYLMLLLVILVAADKLILHRKLFRTKLARDLAIIYLAFIAWTLITRTTQGIPIAVSVIHISSNHIFALVSFIIIQNILVSSRQIIIFGAVLASTAVISALFGVAQWFGIEQAWDVALSLRPGEEETVLGTEVGRFGFIPGLALFSISLSYHLITLGIFVYSWTIHRQRPRTSLVLLGISLTGLIFLAVILSQTRSAAAAMIIVLVASFWFVLRLRSREAKSSKFAVYSYLGVILVLGIGFLISLPQIEQFYVSTPDVASGGYELTRILNIDDPRRTQIAASSIELALSDTSNLALGSNDTEYLAFLSERLDPKERLVSPHNLFLNGLMLGGVPAVGIILILLLGLIRLSGSVIKAIRLEPSLAWVGMGAIYGLVAYLINGQFHNSGFVSGDPMPWWNIGIMVALVAYVMERHKGDASQEETIAQQDPSETPPISQSVLHSA